MKVLKRLNAWIKIPLRTFSLSQMSRTELARVMPWRENEGWNTTNYTKPKFIYTYRYVREID